MSKTTKLKHLGTDADVKGRIPTAKSKVPKSRPMWQKPTRKCPSQSLSGSQSQSQSAEAPKPFFLPTRINLVFATKWEIKGKKSGGFLRRFTRVGLEEVISGKYKAKKGTN